MSTEPTVFVVDDDESVRESLSMLIETIELNVKSFANAQEFLQDYEPNEPGCLVLDVRMPGISGLELQAKLAADGHKIPVIFITGHGDVPMAVGAMKTGAVSFIEKPFRDQDLIDTIQEALEKDAKEKVLLTKRSEIEEKLDTLTPREKQVMDRMVDGMQNKKIAYELEISQKTVDFHRANIYKKMNANTTVELLKMMQ
jgi:FixJ family two-component response regulator